LYAHAYLGFLPVAISDFEPFSDWYDDTFLFALTLGAFLTSLMVFLSLLIIGDV